jgi:predicted DNA-binding protein YlxM (UPF0122 family)
MDAPTIPKGLKRMSKDLKEWASLFLPTRSQQIATMYANGASIDEIAAEFKETTRAVFKYLAPYRPTPDQLEKFRRSYVRKVLAARPKK